MTNLWVVGNAYLVFLYSIHLYSIFLYSMYLLNATYANTSLKSLLGVREKAQRCILSLWFSPQHRMVAQTLPGVTPEKHMLGQARVLWGITKSSKRSQE